MATNASISGNGNGSTPSLIPVFTGEGYEYWSIRMRTLLKSQDLWDFVDQGVSTTSTDQAVLKELRKKDAKALAIIQQGIHDHLFSRIAACDSSQDAWTTLQLEFQGDSQVQAVKLQGLRREFENLMMKDGELVGDYFSRVMAIVSQRRAYGELIADQTVVEKILRTLTPKFDHIVPTIEVGTDLGTITLVKLMGSLQSQEERLNSRSGDKHDEHAFQAIQSDKGTHWRSEERSEYRPNLRQFIRGRGRRGRGSIGMPCYQCHRYGHLKKDCWYADEQQMNVFADQVEDKAAEEAQHLFVTQVNGGNGMVNS